MGALQILRKSFGLDYRSLALYRILMGLIVLADVFYRLPDLVNFYTDQGLVPRATFLTEMTMQWSTSFHLANGSTAFIALSFILYFIAGVMLLVGYKTRWVMLFCWIFTVSIHNRNWLINNGGHDILRAIQFLSIFLPLNRRFSVDAALQKPHTRYDGEFVSTWTFAFILQVFVIYFVSYILKDHPMWRKDFTAIFFASRLDIFATPIGVFTRSFPLYQKFLTFFTVYLEWLGPLLLIFSGLFGKHWWKVRFLVVILFWGLHLGIILTMWIGIFPYLCLAMWALYIPGEVWDLAASKYKSKNFDKLSIYYDGECAFCQKLVLIIREFFLFRDVPVLEAQSKPEIYALMKEKNSWVVENQQGERFFYFSALLEVFRRSPVLRIFVPVLSLGPIASVLHKAYVWVSYHRPLFGKATQFLEYTTPKKRITSFYWLIEGAGAFVFVTLLMWNLSTIKKWKIKPVFFQKVARHLHLYQEWNMFAPFPKMDNIWVEIPAVLEDGSEIELLSGSRDIYSVKSDVFPKNIPNEHWRKFYLNLSDRSDYARYYGGYLCREWNDRKIRWVKNQTLRKMEIIVYSQPNLPDGSRGGITRKLSWKHWCFDEDMKRDNAKASP